MNKKNIVAIIAILALIVVGVLVTVQDVFAAGGCVTFRFRCCVDCEIGGGDCVFECHEGYSCHPGAWCFCCLCDCDANPMPIALCCGHNCLSYGEPCDY